MSNSTDIQATQDDKANAAQMQSLNENLQQQLTDIQSALNNRSVMTATDILVALDNNELMAELVTRIVNHPLFMMLFQQRIAAMNEEQMMPSAEDLDIEIFNLDEYQGDCVKAYWQAAEGEADPSVDSVLYVAPTTENGSPEIVNPYYAKMIMAKVVEAAEANPVAYTEGKHFGFTISRKAPEVNETETLDVEDANSNELH